MLKIVLALFVIFTLNGSLSVAIISTRDETFSARQMGQSMAQCFAQNEIINCLESKIFEIFDRAIANNETWQFSDFLVIEKNAHTNSSPSFSEENQNKLLNPSNGRSLSDTLALKMLQLAQTRSLKLQLPSSFNNMFNKRSISSALDDFNTDTTDEDAGATEQLEQEEGRKKKDKDKNMAMMGGMAMLAMVAQMFLGKVILIAGAAFIMAKVALLISVLGSLKKGAGGSGGGGGTDHVIVTGGGGGGSHSHEYSSGWHRSMPHEQNKFEILPADEHKFTEPVAYYEVAENDEFKRRNQYRQPPIQQNKLNKVNF